MLTCDGRFFCPQADYVLVLISPVYQRVVDGKASQADIESARNALHIYQRMLSEYHASVVGRSQRLRFIAIVMPGSNESEVPQWMRQSIPVYKWPSDYLNLFYWMVGPESVVSNSVKRREQQLAISGAAYNAARSTVPSATVRSAGVGGQPMRKEHWN
jgi:hypothetical protein